MLKSHFAAHEALLLSSSKIQANSGHSIHKGTPREHFVRNFLESHLGDRVAIGTGEIIDHRSRPGEARNQLDIVVYRREYPRLDFGGGICAFLAESVVATISVKSTLREDEFQRDMEAAKAIKMLDRSVVTAIRSDNLPSSILSYVVAYDGPSHMKTVHQWIEGMGPDWRYPRLPSTERERIQIPALGLDAIFVLGKGFLHYGNTPIGFFKDEFLTREPESRWVIGDLEDASLLLLFTLLTTAVSGINGSWLNPLPYLKDFSLPPGKVLVGR